jgi:hypothetical protein
MQSIDLSGLIKGLLVVIGIALAMGRLGNLKRWAAHETFDTCPSKHWTGTAIYGRIDKR